MPPPHVSRLPRGPSFAQFLQRSQVLSFYRSILREVRGHPMKTELKAWARGEIEQNRGVEDTEKVKYLLSTGKQELKRFVPVVLDLSRHKV